MNKVKSLPYVLPADNDRSKEKVSVFTRKAPYQFGWDWGPRLLTCGVWRPVHWLAWNNTRIADFQLYQHKISEKRACLNAVVQIKADKSEKVSLVLLQNDSVVDRKKVLLKKGINNFDFPFHVDHPRLWWTNGLGNPYLYHFSVRLYQNEELVDSKKVRFGIRTLQIVQKPDSAGSSFFVKLNGVPVFIKGANYIPQDNFLPRVTKQRYEELIRAAKRTHMNMLRVWGGGIYENNEFYNLCDENGILVWQDFMFACSFYPGDSSFLNNVRQEAIQNVKRLRNHPCLALWCGNNEIRVAWERWGYQKKYHYSKKDSAQIFHDYLHLFHQLLPNVVRKYDSGRFYWPSSPNSAPKGWKQEAQTGDMHYWGVWWGRKPFSAYTQNVGRFMSEFGFQSIPSLSSLKRFIPDTALYLVSSVMRAHNKHPVGYQTIREYMKRNFKIPNNLGDYATVSQLLQAEGMKIAIEAYRRDRPWCMGSLFWQLNDCWPVVSWSAIDYYGNWKALPYFLQKLYAPVLVSPVYQNHRLKIYLISDKQSPENVQMEAVLYDFYGKKLWKVTKDVLMPSNASRMVFSKKFDNLLKRFSEDKVFLHVSVIKNNIPVATNNLFFVKTKDLQLPKPVLRVKTQTVKDTFEVRMTAKTFVKYVVLQYPHDSGVFSDNYFCLLPGQTKTVKIHLKNAAAVFSDKIKIRTFY